MQGQAVVCAQQRRETSAGSQAVKVSGLGGEITIAGDRFGRRSFCPLWVGYFGHHGSAAPRARRYILKSCTEHKTKALMLLFYM